MRRAVRSALAACLLFGSALSRADEPGDLSTEAIAAATIDSCSSIESIYCVYTVHFQATAKRGELLLKLRYARSAAKWRMVQNDERDGVASEFIRCCDDKVQYAFSISHPGGQDKWGTVQIQDRTPAGFNPECLLGRNMSSVGRSVPDVLNPKTVSRSDVKLADGTTFPCLSIVGVPTSLAGAPQKYDVALTVDPGHDFLPREILVTESAGNITVPGLKQDWNISAYQRVPDKRTKRERWFPTSGLLTQGTSGWPDVKLVVESVRINPPLPDEMFTPDFPEGLQFADHTTDGSGQQAIPGGKFLPRAAGR